LLFRIGIRRKVEMTVDPDGADLNEITNFIERNAGVWGARRDVINRVEFTVQQTIEAVISPCDAQGSGRLDISYDEFIIDASVTYVGTPLEFPTQAPTKEEILNTDEGQRRLAGFLIRRYADRIIAAKHDSKRMMRLHFDH